MTLYVCVCVCVYVCGCFFVLWHINLSGSFDAKAIIVEEQY